MADNSEQKPARKQADKDRSRAQSRAISGKEAAKGVRGQPGKGTKPGSQGSGPKSTGGRGQPSRQGGGGGGGRRPPRSNAPAGPPRRSTTTLLTWGIVALVLIVVIVLVVVKLTGSSNPSSTTYQSGPVPASIEQQVTKVPASVYDTIGVSSPTVAVTPPHKTSGVSLLKFDTKAGVFYMGGEYCPFCAAERWALVTTLSRFGTLTGLQTMQSSSTDVDPSTQTFTFAQAHYSSPYVGVRTRELYSNQPNAAGTGYVILQPLTKQETALVKKYDNSKYAGGSTTSSGSIPFVTIGNQFIVSGASFSPAVLQGLSRAQIAANLTTTNNPATRAIIATSNYLSASICHINGHAPSSICNSKGVQEAAKSMGLSS
ncbi:MAG TPA: DUF929 family protein [Acidimicrobiales bacterium]|nr:DUF929 family protein [Acidimicrobiales bacterium]